MELLQNEVLLVKHKGSCSNNVIPDTYTIDGITYNVTILSYAYIYYYNDATDCETSSDIGIFSYNKKITLVILNDNIKLISNKDKKIIRSSIAQIVCFYIIVI